MHAKINDISQEKFNQNVYDIDTRVSQITAPNKVLDTLVYGEKLYYLEFMNNIFRIFINIINIINTINIINIIYNHKL